MTTQTTPTQMREALARRAEIREAWLARPGNYPPPPKSPREAVDDHHRRWLASPEHAHCLQVMRAAGWPDPDPQPTAAHV